MRYAVIVRTGPEQPEHMPIVDGLAVTGPPPGEAAPRACQATTKAGEPCKGIPGDDGLCAAHKPKGDADAGAVAADLDADPQAEADGEGEEDDGAEERG